MVSCAFSLGSLYFFEAETKKLTVMCFIRYSNMYGYSLFALK